MIKEEWDSEDSPTSSKKESFQIEELETEREIEEIVLDEANPILPPNKHKCIPENETKLKYSAQTPSKLNLTLFPHVPRRCGYSPQNKGSGKAESTERLKIREGVYSQSKIDRILSLEKKDETFFNKGQSEIVYLRFDNKEHCKIGREQKSFPCSLFLDCRKELSSCKTPIYEYLSKALSPETSLKDINSKLFFNSAFESGNLLKAIWKPSEIIPTFEIYMQNDTNTKGCTQWFYFETIATHRIKAKFKIMNFYKPTSLYQEGMKVLISNDNMNWKRGGTSIKYYEDMIDGKETFCLEFFYEIESPNQKYYFSAGYPYTYSQLLKNLDSLLTSSLLSKIVTKTNYCKTYLSNEVPLITITNQPKTSQTKPLIYIIARQHPGESSASYISEGLIKTLLSSRFEMEELRNNFVFKIVPLVNVDGVINGNYRSNISGNDINRQWYCPSKKLHPEIYHLKQEILRNKKNINFFLDIHAHSRKEKENENRMNSFFYGSRSGSSENRLYPFVCSKLNKRISYLQSSFVDDLSKLTTARVVMEKEANIKKSLTFEASFYGFEDKNKSKIHFKEDDLRILGESLALGLYYSEIACQKLINAPITSVSEQEKVNLNSVFSESCHLGNTNRLKSSSINERIAENCNKIIAKWKKELFRIQNEEECSSQGSSLDPEHFELSEAEKNIFESCPQESKSQQSSSKLLEIQEKHKSIEPSASEKEKYENKETIEEKIEFFGEKCIGNGIMLKNIRRGLELQRTNIRYENLTNRKKKKNEEKELVEEKKEMGSSKSVKKSFRYQSVNIEKEGNTYQNSIFEIRKAFKYFIETKNNNYEINNHYFKTPLNQITPLQQKMSELKPQSHSHHVQSTHHTRSTNSSTTIQHQYQSKSYSKDKLNHFYKMS